MLKYLNINFIFKFVILYYFPTTTKKTTTAGGTQRGEGVGNRRRWQRW